MMLAAGIVAALALGGLGALVALQRDDDAGATESSPVAALTPQGATADSASVQVADTRTTEPPSAPAQPLARPTSDARATTQAPAPAPEQPSVAFLLQRLEAKTDPLQGGDAGTAREALRELELLDDRIANTDDDTHAKLLRAEANFLLDRIETGCDILKGIEGRTGPRQNRVKGLLRDLCQV